MMMKSRYISAVALLSAHAWAASIETLSTATDKVYFDIEIDQEPAGQIVIGLFGDVVP